jgi:septum site-determining protein MinC
MSQTLPTEAPDPTPGLLALSATDGVLVLALDAKAAFESLRQAVRDTFSASPDRFRGKDARLDYGERNIDLFDLRRMVHVLRDEFGVTVTGLYCTEQALHRYAERELKLRVYPRRPQATPEPEAELETPVAETTPVEVQVELEPEVPTPPVVTAPVPGSRALTVEGALRSGQVVRFEGDVVVFGDVNPGAEIIATGNVLVLGALKGLVHAGSDGDERAVILSFEMVPTQLRIGSRIAVETSDRADTGPRGVRARLGALASRDERTMPLPELAWVDDASIRRAPYQGRLPFPVSS